MKNKVLIKKVRSKRDFFFFFDIFMDAFFYFITVFFEFDLFIIFVFLLIRKKIYKFIL